MLKSADLALDKAKEEGPQHMRLFSAGLDTALPPEKVAGPRYSEKQMAQVDR